MILVLFITACGVHPTAQEVVDRSIESSGMASLKNATSSFTFRNLKYAYLYRGGQYAYARTQMDSTGNVIRDILSNDGLIRYVNGEATEIAEKQRKAYTRSINSVIYFAFLPLWLNESAVNKALIGIVTIHTKDYYKIKVTFEQEGGGEDYEDEFLYWFDREDYSMDYLAYHYYTEGGGMRYRKAYNVRVIDGVVIQDYKNLKPKEKGSVSFLEIDQAYLQDQLEELSIIELENVAIQIAD